MLYIGDSGYALRPWLLTPVMHAEPNSPEDRYNIAQRRIRSLIERTNGLLKMRFRCLLKHRVLHYKPDVASRIINSCVILHNMCIEENVPLPCPEDDYNVDFGIDINNNDENENAERNRINPELVAGRRLRSLLIQNMFTNIIKNILLEIRILFNTSCLKYDTNIHLIYL